MNLGDVITILENLDPNYKIGLERFISYRGYYDRLAIEPGESTVGELLEEARDADGGIFEGYKGGDFQMERSTPVYVDYYGESNSMALTGLYVSENDTEGIVKYSVADISDYW